ncbi:DNA repair protein-like protein rad50 [Mollisia scopiformis]|uniref:DNA repair protein RAD50 n=1 Tax=Mollisia scopiformis TaxID=149040 RepID=A0A194XWR5_MOLSC|nr:DNA repair protein-like protein rad50 [Mollisia scopiformis]KUJ24581.1 DNA repair protein-like protein rad50 [Mollisia scopiformis]
MSSIHQLSILGVRSFDNRGLGQTIEFKAPLTLIVGYNGSGKTTIIESLKYAATGEFPPNAAKGGAFIHDPKLTLDPEVLARVKMSFYNAQGHQLVIVRRVSCTLNNNKKTYTQKTLDSSLVIKTDGGERQSISGKRLQMDKAVPQYMGVSKAILENVIFCHQEESLWPMSEPSKLKVKFDEIFEAQRYTKAIDSLVKLKKKYASSLKVLENEGKHSKEKNNKAKRVSLKIKSLSEGILAKNDELTILDRDIAEALKLYEEKTRLHNASLAIVKELQIKQEREVSIQYTLDTLQTHLEMRDDSTAELESTLAEFDERMLQYNQQASSFQQQYKDIQDSQTTSRSQLSKKQVEKGRHDAQKKAHEDNLQSRAEIVRDAAQSHSLRGYEGGLDEDQIAEFIARVKLMNVQKDNELSGLRDTTQKEARQHQESITKIENRKSGHSHDKESAKQQIKVNDKMIRERQSEKDAIHMDEGKKAILDASYQDSKELLENIQSAYELAGWDTKLARQKDSLSELEGELTRLGQELMQRTKTMNETAALELARKETQQAQSALQSMISTYGEQLNKVVGKDWTPESLQRKYEVALEQIEDRLTEKKKLKERADKVYDEHNIKLEMLKSDLIKKDAEIESCKAAVLASIKSSDGKPITAVDEYLVELHALEADREEAQKDLNSASEVSGFYRKALDTVDKQNCCRLCERTFVNQKEKLSAADKLKKLLEKFVKEKLEEDLKNINAELKEAQKVHPRYDIWKQLVEVDIPAIKQEIQAMEEKSEPLISRCEKQDDIVSNEESYKRDVSLLRNTVADITKYCADVTKQNDRVTLLSSQQNLTGSSLTLSEIEDQQATCGSQIKTAKANVEKITADRDAAKTEISARERQVATLLNEVNSAQYQLEKKQALSDAIKNLQASNLEQNKAIKHASKNLELIEPELSTARALRDDALTRGERKADVVRADKNKLSQTVNKLDLIETSIDNYLASGAQSKLAACDRAIEALDQDLKRYEKELQDLTTKSNRIKGLIADSSVTKRNIQENIKYRKSLKDLEDIQRQVNELQARDTHDEAKKLTKEARAAETRWQVLKSKKEALCAQIAAEDRQYKEAMLEWDQEYAGAAQKWREDNVKVQTTHAAVEDLQKCTQALDRAIIQFHTMKMEEVNSIAAELWRSTYQGTDVDTIMIKSEDDQTTTTASNTRKYNYRLVMVKQDAELDMRARCSAGQKVLASIIIRLALAESFGANCGVIALDEPTTNLDTDNIKALARSLNQIIKNRKHQKNFQLIIITHDEAFIREMKCREFTDEYWRVYRNADQNSEIKKQDLSVIDDD